MNNFSHKSSTLIKITTLKFYLMYYICIIPNDCYYEYFNGQLVISYVGEVKLYDLICVYI